jgi:hypothetical protein
MTIKIHSFYQAPKKRERYPTLNIDFFDALSAKVWK